MGKQNSLDLQAKLKKADPEIRHYVRELEKHNAKLQADNVNRENRIKALKKGNETPDHGERLRRATERMGDPKLHIQVASYKEPTEQEFIALAEKYGFQIVKKSS